MNGFLQTQKEINLSEGSEKKHCIRTGGFLQADYNVWVTGKELKDTRCKGPDSHHSSMVGRALCWNAFSSQM